MSFQLLASLNLLLKLHTNGQFMSGRASSITLSAWRRRHAQHKVRLQQGRRTMDHGLSSKVSAQMGQSLADESDKGWRTVVCFLEGWSRYITRNYRHCLILKHGHISVEESFICSPKFFSPSGHRTATSSNASENAQELPAERLSRGGKGFKKQKVHFWIHC